MFILIVVTYLGGASWGPQVATQEFASRQSCEHARTHVIETVERMNASNLRLGVTQREILSAACLTR